MSNNNNLVLLSKYKLWSDQRIFDALFELPEEEVLAPRETKFGNITSTLSHVFVIDSVFRCHLLSEPHSYTTRNLESQMPLADLWHEQRKVDHWYIEYASSLSQAEAMEDIEFAFIDGGYGKMSRADIVNHVVNHATYHRGFVASMIYQSSRTPPVTDLPVYLLEQKNAQ